MDQNKEITRREERGMRLSGHLTIQATRAVEKIRETYGTRTYDILSSAAVFYVKIMDGSLQIPGLPAIQPLYQSTPTTKTGQPRQRADSQTTQALSVAKAIWCEEAGGTVMGNICHFDKFEVTMAGTVESSKRSVPLKDMPDLKEDFMKLIMGSYANINEARKAAADNK